MSILERLSEHLQTKAISLADLGAEGYAWPAEDALDVIVHLKREGLAILGGDVLWPRNDERIEFTYDNWYLKETRVVVARVRNAIPRVCSQLRLGILGKERAAGRSVQLCRRELGNLRRSPSRLQQQERGAPGFDVLRQWWYDYKEVQKKPRGSSQPEA